MRIKDEFGMDEVRMLARQAQQTTLVRFLPSLLTHGVGVFQRYENGAYRDVGSASIPAELREVAIQHPWTGCRLS